MLVLGLCIGQLKGQLTRHACVGGQSVSCARAVFRISPSQQFFVFFYEDVQPMFSFFLKFCHRFH